MTITLSTTPVVRVWVCLCIDLCIVKWHVTRDDYDDTPKSDDCTTLTQHQSHIFHRYRTKSVWILYCTRSVGLDDIFDGDEDGFRYTRRLTTIIIVLLMNIRCTLCPGINVQVFPKEISSPCVSKTFGEILQANSVGLRNLIKHLTRRGLVVYLHLLKNRFFFRLHTFIYTVYIYSKN